MEDLQYIIGIGFSGSDLGRAVLITFLFASFAKRDTNIWKISLIALIIDRVIWPITGLATSGAEIHTVYASIGALFSGFSDDLGIYIVRYMGLVLMISGFRWLRGWIQQLAPRKAAHA